MDAMSAALQLVRDGLLQVRPDGSIWRCRTRTNTGKVKEVQPRRAECKAKNGYLLVNVRLGGKAGLVYAHRLVWTAIQGQIPEGLDINHRDGDKTNNHPDNLEPATRSENHRHAFRTGLRGTPWGIKPEVRATAVSMRKEGRTLKEIAVALNIGQSTACRLCKRSS